MSDAWVMAKYLKDISNIIKIPASEKLLNDLIPLTQGAKGLLWPTLLTDDFHDTGRKGSAVAY